MEMLLLLGLAGTALFSLVDWGGDDGESDSSAEGETPEDSEIVIDAESEGVTGTTGDDMIRVAPDTILRDIAIASDEGDDTIDLARSDQLEDFHDRLTVDAGPGDDEVTGFDLHASDISGREGHDRMAIEMIGGVVSGGAGDDEMEVTGDLANPTEVFGGEGDDTLSGYFHANLHGGSGHDLLNLSGYGDAGAGYGVTANGGAGDDTIGYSNGGVPADAGSPGYYPNSVEGGSGQDRFALELTAGGLLPSGQLEEGEGLPVNDDGNQVIEVLNIRDFEPGIDILEIAADGEGEDDPYSLTSAQLENTQGQGTGGTTTLRLNYESDVLPPRELQVHLRSSAVTWDDITFLGDGPATISTTTASA